jgi:hypothetical protein
MSMTMAEQFGTAIMPPWPLRSSPLISGMTSGTSPAMR